MLSSVWCFVSFLKELVGKKVLICRGQQRKNVLMVLESVIQVFLEPRSIPAWSGRANSGPLGANGRDGKGIAAEEAAGAR